MNSPTATISLRPVRADDREMIFRWRNDPFILAHGSSNCLVSWEEHTKWFEQTIEQRDRKMYIVLYENVPIGQVRFDRRGQQDCVVSVYLSQEFTGRGLGVHAIAEGCGLAFGHWDIERVIACVRNDNPSGRSAFLKAGFEEEDVGTCPSNHHSLVLRRNSLPGLDG